MERSDPQVAADAARWAGRLVVALVTFWGFVAALAASWAIEASGAIDGNAFTWALRALTAAATAGAFAIGSRLAPRVTPRFLRPLAVSTGITLALVTAFLFMAFLIRPGR